MSLQIPSSGPANYREVTVKKTEVRKTEIKHAVEAQNKKVQDAQKQKIKAALDRAVRNRRYSYSFNENMKSFVVKIIDEDSNEIIKEIPSAEIQKLHENIEEAIGLLFDQEI